MTDRMKPDNMCHARYEDALAHPFRDWLRADLVPRSQMGLIERLIDRIEDRSAQ